MGVNHRFTELAISKALTVNIITCFYRSRPSCYLGMLKIKRILISMKTPGTTSFKRKVKQFYDFEIKNL